MPEIEAIAAIVALACVVVPVRLLRTRRRRPDPALPLAQSLRAELDEASIAEGGGDVP